MSVAASANPYQPPSADLGDGLDLPGAEEAVAIRRAYLKHEASVRSIGLLYYISAGMFGLIGFATLLAMATDGGLGAQGLPMVALMLLLGALFGSIGRGIRRLRSSVRIPLGFLSVIFLFNPPIGTLLNGYILFLVFGTKGKVVFSEDYAAVRAATPHIQYETSLLVKIFAGLLVAAIAAGIVAALVPSFVQ